MASKRNYFLRWFVNDGGGSFLGGDQTHVDEVHCDTSAPPVNNPVPCETLDDLCRAIDPA